MKASRSRARRRATTHTISSREAGQSVRGRVPRRASVFRNGRNQAVRLPQDFAFSPDVKEVQVSRHGDAIVLAPVKPDWSSFFSLEVEVPETFLSERGDLPAQSRDPP